VRPRARDDVDDGISTASGDDPTAGTDTVCQFVQRLVRRDNMVAYYGCFLGATGVMVLLTLVVRALTTMAADQSYFVVVLTVLLMHYYFDHFLFSHPQMVE